MTYVLYQWDSTTLNQTRVRTGLPVPQPRRRTTLEDWAELVDHLRPGEAVAATTEELDAMYSYGPWRRERTRPPAIRGHRLVEVEEW